MDTRDRPERDYYVRDPPPRPREQVADPIHRESQYEYYLRTQPGVFDSEGRRINPLVEVVNNPGVTVTAAEVRAINDPKKAMLPTGQIVKAVQQRGRSPLYPPLRTKRTRKKTKMDKKMSAALKTANAKCRCKNGRLKKGKTQGDVMKMAHRLCKRS